MIVKQKRVSIILASACVCQQMYLLRFGIGITAVINESRHVSLLCSVDDFVRTQRHEVVMLVVLACISPRATLEGPVVQHLTNVLHYESTTDRQKQKSPVNNK